jgi:hypothetical protein
LGVYGGEERQGKSVTDEVFHEQAANLAEKMTAMGTGGPGIEHDRCAVRKQEADDII